MGFSPFAPHPGNEAIKFRQVEAPKQVEATNRLASHMVEISNDPTGSDPADYLSPKDTETCMKFIELANEMGWPNTSPLEMRSSYDFPAWTNPKRTAKSGLTKVLFFRKSAPDKRGYIFGQLSINPSQPVALCEDGLLRSQRGRELQRSNGIGWGRLPDPEILLPALAVGDMYGVNYTNAASKTLAQKLMANLPGADPARLR